RTFGGADTVVTTGLPGTIQVIETSGDASPDTLTFDAAGLCPFRQGDTFEVVGRQPVQFSGFANALAINAVCGAILDLSAGGGTYIPTHPTVDAARVALADAPYPLHDAGEALISVTPNAAVQGCMPVAPNTATCPAAAIASFSIFTGFGDDTVVLAGAVHPAIVRGGPGNDMLVGGAGD